MATSRHPLSQQLVALRVSILITGVTGLTDAQKLTLKALGAIDA
jgi:hypothetical protein